MSYKVKIQGAGSIGNHLSNASRHLGWAVDLCDIDGAALKRTQNEIYPQRYGVWDESIRLFDSSSQTPPTGDYDLIIIGTPPDNHIPLALDAVRETPKAVLIEKPVCTPDMSGAQELYELSHELKVPVFTGYDHVVGQASRQVTASLGSGALGAVSTIDVEFREYWGGIFAAHPWLDGPQDTYLGFWKRGGGASGEHSHATNLWQHFAHAAGFGRVVEVTANLDFVRDGALDYDRLCLANLRTQSGMIGRVVQDVVTQPPRKWARIQGEQGYTEWHCGYEPGCDVVIEKTNDQEADTTRFEKTRPDDFIQELRHIESAITGDECPPDITLERGLDTMLVISAMHKSAQEGRTVHIDYSKGYRPDALSTV